MASLDPSGNSQAKRGWATHQGRLRESDVAALRQGQSGTEGPRICGELLLQSLGTQDVGLSIVSIVMGLPQWWWFIENGKSQSKMDDFRGTPILGNLHVWPKIHGSRRRHGSSGMVTHLDKCSSEFWDAKSPFQQSEFHPSGHDTGSLSYLLSGKAISRPDLTWDLTCFFVWRMLLVHCQRNSYTKPTILACPPSPPGMPISCRGGLEPPEFFFHTMGGPGTWHFQRCRGAAMGWFTLEMGHVR